MKTDNPVVEVLKKARALIAKPGGWTKHSMARNKHGEQVSVTHAHAKCFCTMGAIFHAARNKSEAIEYEAMFAIRSFGPGKDQAIAPWNDAEERKHSEVLAAFDKAIASFEPQS